MSSTRTLIPHIDKTGSRVICGRMNCRGELAALSTGEEFIWPDAPLRVQFSKEMSPRPDGVWALTTYAREARRLRSQGQPVQYRDVYPRPRPRRDLIVAELAAWTRKAFTVPPWQPLTNPAALARRYPSLPVTVECPDPGCVQLSTITAAWLEEVTPEALLRRRPAPPSGGPPPSRYGYL